MRRGRAGADATGGALGVAGVWEAVLSSLVFEGGEAQAPSSAEAQAIEKLRRERWGERGKEGFNDVSNSDDVRHMPSPRIC